jgi:hypothetical protein
LLPENPFEGAFLSSPGIRKDEIILKTVGAIYQLGNIDCGMASIFDTRYQRPALYKLDNYDGFMVQTTYRGLVFGHKGEERDSVKLVRERQKKNEAKDSIVRWDSFTMERICVSNIY